MTKFRKGACENCGAMTHTAKTCTERPRKQGAKITGSDIKVRAAAQAASSSPSPPASSPSPNADVALRLSGGRTPQPDEVVEEFDLDWDSKRDRWNGYNPDDYSQQLEGGWNAVLHGRGGQGGAHARGRDGDAGPYQSGKRLTSTATSCVPRRSTNSCLGRRRGA